MADVFSGALQELVGIVNMGLCDIIQIAKLEECLANRIRIEAVDLIRRE